MADRPRGDLERSQNYPESLSATIANAGTDSAEVDLNGTVPVGIVFPAAMTGTSVSFKMATSSGGTFVPVYDDDGALYTVSVVVSIYRALKYQHFIGARYIKVISNGAEGAERVLTLRTRAI
jgi:hypothetical protein